MESSAAGWLGETLVGASKNMLTVHGRIQTVAKVQRTTLILGPTGAGKDVVARSLHDCSTRRAQPFVAVHCAALPEQLVEAELFGHCRGAFTGALQARSGLIRSAAHGTLFLDEVDSLSLAAQAKLLRFLETGEYRAVGSDDVERSSAWVVAATNQNLHQRVRAGTFREDLLYRLEVVKIEVPPLHERRGDVLLLARHFLVQLGCGDKQFSPGAQAALEAHSWPGNVRELKHRVEAAALLNDGAVIAAETLGLVANGGTGGSASTPLEGSELAPSSGEPPGLERELWRLVQERGLTLIEATAACERLLVEAALRAENNNRTRAAGRLGINVRTIYKKLESPPR
jgi:DNA-binding NtrC family response regulator